MVRSMERRRKLPEKRFWNIDRKWFEPERVVVERNLEIIPSEALGHVMIQDEDVIEVLRFVGGG